MHEENISENTAPLLTIKVKFPFCFHQYNDLTRSSVTHG